MKISKKIKIASTILAIIAILELFQSSLLNTIGIMLIVMILYDNREAKQLMGVPPVGLSAAPDVSSDIKPVKRGIFSYIIGNICFYLIYLELFTLPMMVLYLVSPYSFFNFVFGIILGIGCSTVLHGRIFRLMAIWILFITFNLSLVSIMVILALSR